jgi:hypothetical protein
VCLEQLRAMRVVGGHSRRELTSILDVLQHSRQQERRAFATDICAQRAFGNRGEVVDGCYPALMMEFTHRFRHFEERCSNRPSS